MAFNKAYSTDHDIQGMTVSHVNAHTSPLAVSKSYFSLHVFFRVCAYLPTGFAVYRMILDHIILLTVL